jgi:hypothetical protein
MWDLGSNLACACMYDITKLNLQAELMRSEDTDELDYEYLTTMMTPAYLGYNIQNVKKVLPFPGW